MPQYYSYNNIHATRYNYSIKQQMAARIITPYLELERIEKNEEYLLGVVRAEDYGLGHNYRNFNEIMYRYELDNLDMDVIWKNLYNNTMHRYGKKIVGRYVKNSAKGLLAPIFVGSEMSGREIISHHGYYYGLFQNNNPKIANTYMKFGNLMEMIIVILIMIQLVVKIVIDFLSGKFKMKIQEGKHQAIEAIVLGICVCVVYTLVQTLFSLEGTSYVTSIAATLGWLFATAFLWFEKSSDMQ